MTSPKHATSTARPGEPVMSTRVTTQSELDSAIASDAADVYTYGPDGAA